MEDALYSIQTEEPIPESQQTEGHRARSKWSSSLTSKRQKPSEKPFRGRYVRAIPPTGPLIDLAWDATIRNAACHQSNRCRKPHLAIDIDKTDLLRKWRVRRPGRLILFVVDISGSMGGQNMQLAKEVSLKILEHAYIKRDRVAIVAFRDRSAQLLVPPTDQSELINRVVSELQCGGRTPLGQGLQLAHTVIKRTLNNAPGVEPILILITDGRGNVGTASGYEGLQREIDTRAIALRSQAGLRVLFLDTSERGKEDFCARRLSNCLRAERLLLWQLLHRGFDPTAQALQFLSR